MLHTCPHAPSHAPRLRLQVMADKGEVWARVVKAHGLQDLPLDKLATWTFADFMLSQPGDW